MSEIKITTKPCMVCFKASEITVSAEAYHRWERGELIQRAFPELSDNERELLITGIHPECWIKIFGEED